MNPNILEPANHQFYGRSESIAERMYWLGYKYPSLRADPRYQYLFSWEWELPLTAYLVMLTSVSALS